MSADDVLRVDGDISNKRFEVSVDDWVGLSCGEGVNDARTGRTKGLMLSAIGEACLNPFKWVPFRDHLPSDSRHELLSMMTSTIRLLDLEIEVSLDCSKTIIIRNLYRPSFEVK